MEDFGGTDPRITIDLCVATLYPNIKEINLKKKQKSL